MRKSFLLLVAILIVGLYATSAFASSQVIVPLNPDKKSVNFELNYEGNEEFLVDQKERLKNSILRPTTIEDAKRFGLEPIDDNLLKPSVNPVSSDLLEFMPPVGEQQFNDCSAFAFGYYGISYWNFKYNNISLSNDPSYIASSAYLYNQTNGGEDTGVIMVAVPYLVSLANGCAVETKFHPLNYMTLPSINTQKQSLNRVTKRAGYFYIGRNTDENMMPDPGGNPVSVTEISQIKSSIAQGIPVIFGAMLYESFMSIANLAEEAVYL